MLPGFLGERGWPNYPDNEKRKMEEQERMKEQNEKLYGLLVSKGRGRILMTRNLKRTAFSE
jgi:hypothetical protein